MTRIPALDITKGIAVLGMIYMNFRIVLSQGDFDLSYNFLSTQEGRFGVLFIFLAGMGVSLLSRKDGVRKLLLKRAAFLFVVGMLFSLYWFADILHFYSLYILMALPLLKLKKEQLYLLAWFPMFISLFLQFNFDWEKGWDFVNFQYVDFYSVAGFFRNLLFNGFHPLFPWFSFFLFGMAVGKGLPMEKKKTVFNLIISVVIVLVTEVLSFSFESRVTSDLYIIVFSTRSFPPSVFFVLSGAAQSFGIFSLISLLLRFIDENGFLMTCLSQIGRMVLTHYILHLIVGLIPLMILSLIYEMGDWLIFAYSFIYFLLSLAITSLWHMKFSRGPLEALMRRFD